MRRPAWLALELVVGCYANRPALRPLPARLGPPPTPPPANGSLWHPELAQNYAFLDVRARFPGDLLTIVVDEKSLGDKKATTNGKNDSSLSASVQDFFGIPAAAVKILPAGFSDPVMTAATKRSSDASGETTRSGVLSANITVTVLAVDGAGNLQVQGDKIVTLNSEDQHLVLTGWVRPEDIRSDNSILSSRVADARISYYGYGAVGDMQRRPLAQHLMDWIWPF
jgi:flagellar L-ring protein precursor FlgH